MEADVCKDCCRLPATRLTTAPPCCCSHDDALLLPLQSYLEDYINRCVAQLRSRQNVYGALTALQNLLLLWAKLYGPETVRVQPARI